MNAKFEALKTYLDKTHKVLYGECRREESEMLVIKEKLQRTAREGGALGSVSRGAER